MLQIRNVSKFFPGVTRARQRLTRLCAGRGPCHRRRKRRRQEHADQDHLRHLHARRGRGAARRRARCTCAPTRMPSTTRSTSSARKSRSSPRARWPKTSCSTRSNATPSAAPSTGSRLNRDAEQYMDLVGLDLPSTTLVGGLSAAQKQLIMIARSLSSECAHPDPGRADLGAHPPRDGEPAAAAAQASRPTASPSSLSRTSWKRCSRSPTRSPSCAMAASSAHGRRPGLTKPDIVRMMIGRDARTSSLGNLDSRLRRAGA